MMVRNDINQRGGISLKSKRVMRIGLLVVLALTMMLAACGDKGKEAGGTKEGSTDNGTKGEGGGTLVFGRGGDSVALDPAIVTDGESYKVLVNVTETLVDFGKDNMELNPLLAESWEKSEDGLTYTFKLKQGVKFHDDTDFNAEAVVKNVERWKNGDDKFAYYHSQFRLDEKDVIESVTAEDEHTVVFKLSTPQAPFLRNIAMSAFAMLSPTAFEADEKKMAEAPIGTGPFKFVEWKRNDAITIEKFDGYHVEGLPKLDKIIYRAIPDNSARLNELSAGSIDVADGINPSDAAGVKGNDQLQLIERPSMNVGYFGLTVSRKPFDDKLVRQAANYAVDKQAIVDAFFEGYAEVANTPLPPVLEAHNENIKAYPYDPEKAKELLKEAGYKGEEFELWAMPVPRPYMPDGQKIAEAIQKNFEDVGLKAKIVSFEWATYLEKATAGDADSFLLGWTGDNGDADNFLYTLLDEDNIGSNNYTFYKNDELHKLLIDAQTEVDEDKRNEMYKKAQEIIHEDAPWIPIAHSTPLLAATANVSNYVAHPTSSDKLLEVELK